MNNEKYFGEMEYTPHEVSLHDDWLKIYHEDLWEEIKFSSRPNKEKGIYWIFRGDYFEEKPFLQTSLDKAFDLYDVPGDEKTKYEKGIIKEFQRKASLYIEHEPDKDDILEWLSLMRHYGAPVRLIDWNYSFFLSTYWALARKKEGVVWALDSSKLRTAKEIEVKVEANDAQFTNDKCNLLKKNDVLGIRNYGDRLVDLAIVTSLIRKQLPLVYAVNPFRLNRRLTAQQGVFLVCGDIEKSFRCNLKAVFENNEELKRALHRIVIKVDNGQRNKILQDLKTMNICNEVLIKGLDGFAKSLEEQLAYPWTFGDISA